MKKLMGAILNSTSRQFSPVKNFQSEKTILIMWIVVNLCLHHWDLWMLFVQWSVCWHDPSNVFLFKCAFIILSLEKNKVYKTVAEKEKEEKAYFSTSFYIGKNWSLDNIQEKSKIRYKYTKSHLCRFYVKNILGKEIQYWDS